MPAATYEKGNWKAVADHEELANGKSQGLALLLQGGAPSHEQMVHRTIDVSDTVDGALEEAKLLAHRILGDLQALRDRRHPFRPMNGEKAHPAFFGNALTFPQWKALQWMLPQQLKEIYRD